jgi:xanthine dehydrogenase accessory factor
MTCSSGGTVEIFIEPVLAAARLTVFGVSPVARAVAQLGKTMGYLVDIVDPDAHPAELPYADRIFTDLMAGELRVGPPAAYIVVASMGEIDEDAVSAALTMRPRYLGVVASRKRYAILRENLLDRGIASHALDTIKNPAGLDLGGRQPEEVALSILAEIIQLKNAAEKAKPDEAKLDAKPARTALPIALVPDAPALAAPTADAGRAIDPVCQMKVTIATARHVGAWDGRTWYFCNPRCKDKFLAEPTKYAAKSAPGDDCCSGEPSSTGAAH